MEQEEIKSKDTKWIKVIFKLLMSGLAFYILYNKVDIDIVKAHLSNSNLFYLFLAFITFAISKVISAFRLNKYYRTQNVLIDQLTNVKIYFNAMFYNIIIPLVGGEAFKVIWIRNFYKAETKPLIWSALLDRGGGLVALIALTICTVYFIDITFPYQQYIGIGLFAAYFGSWLIHYIFFKSYASAQFSVNVYSLFVQLLQVLTAYFVLISLNVTTDQLEYLFVFMLSSFAYVLPFLGARELAFVYGAEILGLNQEISLTISLLFYLVIVGNSLLGAIFFIFPIKKQ